MLGSTFLIDDGAVRFVGTDYANPELDMKATKRMPKYGDINIELTGLVSNIQPVFSEESGQYDDTDVMSLSVWEACFELTESEGDGELHFEQPFQCDFVPRWCHRWQHGG